MNKKIVGIFVMTMLIASSLVVVGTYDNNYEHEAEKELSYQELLNKYRKNNLENNDEIIKPSSQEIEHRPLLIIPVEFVDAPFTHDWVYYRDLFYTGLNGWSVNGYFDQNSYGYFQWLPASAGAVYCTYGIHPVVPGGLFRSDDNWNDGHKTSLAMYVIEYVDIFPPNDNPTPGIGHFDFAKFDNPPFGNGDGIIENWELTILIICSGTYPVGSGNSPGSWWAFAPEFATIISTNDPLPNPGFFAKLCGEYGMTTEDVYIGTIAHELCHSFTCRDLYDTTNHDSFGIGDWGVMGTGSHCGGISMSAVTKAWSTFFTDWNPFFPVSKWLSPVRIPQGHETWYYLENVNEIQDAIILETTDPNEFFVLENRQMTGYEALINPFETNRGFLKGQGIVIYHIKWDELQDEPGEFNSVNGDEESKFCDVECPDNPTSHVLEADHLDREFNEGDGGDVWNNIWYNFNDTSTPCNSTLYDGSNSNCGVYWFPQSDSSMLIFVTTMVDNEIPECNPPSFIGPNHEINPTTFFITDQTATLITCFDNGGGELTGPDGLRRIDFSIDGSGWVAWNFPPAFNPGDVNGLLTLILNEPCHHDVELRAVDLYDNKGDIENLHLIVDLEAPESDITFVGPNFHNRLSDVYWVTTSTEIWLNAQDLPFDPAGCASGIKEISYRVSDDPYEPSGPFLPLIDNPFITINDECRHLLEFYAEDNVENIGETVEYKINVDDTKPEYINENLVVHPINETNNLGLYVTLTGHDLPQPNSLDPCVVGMDEIEYRVKLRPQSQWFPVEYDSGWITIPCEDNIPVELDEIVLEDAFIGKTYHVTMRYNFKDKLGNYQEYQSKFGVDQWSIFDYQFNILPMFNNPIDNLIWKIIDFLFWSH